MTASDCRTDAPKGPSDAPQEAPKRCLQQPVDEACGTTQKLLRCRRAPVLDSVVQYRPAPPRPGLEPERARSARD
eukprot:1245173-Pyramimonas_sp.AAC.1